MKGINVDYCNVALRALGAANQNLLATSVKEALNASSYGNKTAGLKDTLGLDAIPEITIGEVVRQHDPDTILITEESGASQKLQQRMIGGDVEDQPVMFFCDPTDRSAYLRRFLDKFRENRGSEEIGALLKDKDALKTWEQIATGPNSITGATSAITCIRKGRIVFGAILNYVTQELYVACSAGSYRFPLRTSTGKENGPLDIKRIIRFGKPIDFPEIIESDTRWTDWKRFVTFLGKSGYQENFNDSMIFIEDGEKFLSYREPGGPARILYLSTLQPKTTPIGFVLANGEKIGEWIHWLAFVRFSLSEGARSLAIYEVYHNRPWTKEGVLMSTTPPYSLFQASSGKDIGMVIDVGQLARFPNPSLFRSTLLVATRGNQWARRTMVEHRYREIVLPPTTLI